MKHTQIHFLDKANKL